MTVLLPQPLGVKPLDRSVRPTPPGGDRRSDNPDQHRGVSDADQNVGGLRIAAVRMLHEVPGCDRHVHDCPCESDSVAEAPCSALNRECRDEEDQKDADPQNKVGAYLLGRAFELVVGQVPLEVNEPPDNHDSNSDPERPQGLAPNELGHDVKLPRLGLGGKPERIVVVGPLSPAIGKTAAEARRARA